MNEKEHQVSSYLFDSLSNIRTIITLRLEKSMENGLLQKVGMVFPLFRRYTVINEWKWFVADMLITLIYGIVVTGFVYQHWEPGKVFYIGSLITLLGYVNQFTSVFSNVAGQYTDIVQYKAHIDGATLISDAFKEQHRSDSSCALPSQWRHMEISCLHFSHREVYDAQHTSQSLHNIQLNIERGKRIALIGASGSGKSTLFALLRGLHQPEEGACFKVDGTVYPLDSLHGTITLFPQEPEIFENTIEYNVTLGLPFSEEEIMKVCEQAHFSEVIKQLPQGLLTDIREKGVNLSGGQKQRLALARGILAARDSDVILLDEPTSSVDSKTEAMIYDKLFNTFSDKAIISSMHRLHLLDRFDYIYVLDQGRIIEEGTLDHLLLTSHVFKELWHHQNLHYVSELYK
jgi:ABC-type multidrug transport system fused ATPase/permease subunit